MLAIGALIPPHSPGGPTSGVSSGTQGMHLAQLYLLQGDAVPSGSLNSATLMLSLTRVMG